MLLNKDQRAVWDKLVDPWGYYGPINNNSDLLIAIDYAQNDGKVSQALGKYMIELADRLLHRKHYQSLVYADDLVQAAVMQMLISYQHFDSTKSNNPFGFLVQVSHSAFLHHISKENKQKRIEEDLLERTNI